MAAWASEKCVERWCNAFDIQFRIFQDFLMWLERLCIMKTSTNCIRAYSALLQISHMIAPWAAASARPGLQPWAAASAPAAAETTSRLLLRRERGRGRGCVAGLATAGLVSIHRRAAAGGRGRPTVRIVATAASAAALVPIVRFETSPSFQTGYYSCCTETMLR